MKEMYEMDYKGTKITIDQKMIFITGGLLSMVGLLLAYREIYPALTILLLAALPYLHEAGHYLIAREHGFDITSISFENHKIEMVTPDLLTHRDTMDIALGGELVTGAVYLLSSFCIFLWGRSTGSPIIVLFLIIPALWI
jgi:hypothetical protein